MAAVGGAVLLGAASPASAAGSDDAPVVVINQQINNIVVEDARGAEMMFELKPVYITHISTNNTSGDNSPVDVPSFSWGSVSQGTF
ncbi:hypothetical protein [Streptomyces apocyni]|uniref:hypothetical protein n=1 Tax=Streptomyces apocyni TaxID=2654677 RepID=UPI0012E9F069|nr:hypothetical protein [Streptomyces apocyni]